MTDPTLPIVDWPKLKDLYNPKGLPLGALSSAIATGLIPAGQTSGKSNIVLMMQQQRNNNENA